jgi:ADP-ribose pyrophosphatase
VSNQDKVIKRENVFSTPWFTVIAKTVDTATAPFYSLQLLDYVTILAITESQRILLVQQYRPAVERFTLELPSGHVELGEQPETAAKRELIEETGYTGESIELLGSLVPDSGRLSNHLWCFFAENVKQTTPNPTLEHGISLVTCTLAELQTYMQTNEFDHALHLAVIMLAIAKQKIRLG